MLKVNLTSDDEDVALLNRQKQFVRELAAKLDNGDNLATVERRNQADFELRIRDPQEKFPAGETALLRT